MGAFSLIVVINLLNRFVMAAGSSGDPSMSNGGGNWENNFGQGFTTQQVNDINSQLSQTRTQRVRAAIFPETLESGTVFPYPQRDPSNPTAVQKLSEPSHMLKQAVTGILNYQDDADLVVRVAPELIRLLSSRDPQAVASAQLMCNQLSKKEASRVAMDKSAPLVAAICGSLQTASQPQNCVDVCSALCNMSRNGVGLHALFTGGVIPLLIKLLGSSVEKVVFLSMSCLHNLLLHQKGSKEAIIQAGGVVKISHLFKVNNAKFLALAADSLQMLSYGIEEVKEEISSTGVVEELVRIMSSAEYEKLLYVQSFAESTLGQWKSQGHHSS